MNINRIIEKVKCKLREEARIKGVWEDFGEKEYLKLKDKYGDCKEIQDFFIWCINADDKKIKSGY